MINNDNSSEIEELETKIVRLALNIARLRVMRRYVDYSKETDPICCVGIDDVERYVKLFQAQLDETAIEILVLKTCEALK